MEKAKQFLAAGKGRARDRTIGRHFPSIRLQNQDLDEHRGHQTLTLQLVPGVISYSINRPGPVGQWECTAMKGVDVLRDQYGNRIGEIQIDGSKQVLVDRYFVRLGSYDFA